MDHLDIILILMAVLVGLYSAAEKINISYPILLVIAGLGIGFIPGLPLVQLTPEVAFLLFLPPLLFDAARHTSWHDFKKNRDAIGRLAIGLVLFTTAGVAICAYYLIPGFTWPLAFVLGAIVSPPDAVAATSAIKNLHLPKRMVAILEGESLVNDASALIAYRYALMAVMSGSFVLWNAAAQFIWIVIGGIAVGILIGYIFIWLHKQFLNNATVETVLTFILPFASYLLAEKIHASGILAVVSTGLMISWRAHEIFSFQTRMQMNGFWETIIFLLNGFVFILIGLQLPTIIQQTSDHTLAEMIQYGLIISAVVISVRIIWIYPTVHIANWIDRLRGHAEATSINNKKLFVIGWSGMRGVVSLATALALPLTLENGDAFPQRNLILFVTFVVILVTLVFQGLTLPLLIRFLKVAEPKGKAALEEKRLRLALAKGAQKFIDESLGATVHEQALAEVKNRIERQISYLNGILKTESSDQDITMRHQLFGDYLRSEQSIIDHQRKILIEIHKKGSFSADVLRRIERDLDARSLTIAGKITAFK